MKTILFADDQKNIRQWFKEEFEEEGYQVILARDGAEAVRLVEQSPPDLAVLDLWMPSSHGLEAAERIKGIAPQVPVLLFTGNDELCLNDDRNRFAAACIDKSGDLSELKRAVDRALHVQGHYEPRVGLPPVASVQPAVAGRTLRSDGAC